MGWWNWCCCGSETCVTTRRCCVTSAPALWRLSAGSVGVGTGNDCADDCCGMLSGDWWIASQERIRAKAYAETSPGSGVYYFYAWTPWNIQFPTESPTEASEIACVWGSADVESPTSDDPGPANYFPVQQLLCDTPCVIDSDGRSDPVGDLGNHIAPAWVVFIECRSDGMGGEESRLVAVGQILQFTIPCSGSFIPGWQWVAHIRAATAWDTAAALQALIDAADVTPISLSVVTMTNATYDPDCPGASADADGNVIVPSPYGCDFTGATITLSAVSDACSRLVAGCDTACSPRIEYDDLVFAATLPDGDIQVCMGRVFDDATCLPYWTGTAVQPYGTCASSVTITATVKCVSSVWILEVVTPEGTFTFPLENMADPFAGADVSGTLDMCTGETGLAMVGTIAVCSDPPAIACCPGWGCCPPQNYVVDQTESIGGGTVHVTGTFSFDSVAVKWTGTLLWQFTCGFAFADVTWTAGEIECTGSSSTGFTLSYDDGTTQSVGAASGNCDTRVLTFTVLSPVLCDATRVNVTLVFNPA